MVSRKQRFVLISCMILSLFIEEERLDWVAEGLILVPHSKPSLLLLGLGDLVI